MKKPNNLTLVGYVIGVAFALLSAIRYFLLYPDTDRALVYVGIGVIVCSIAFLYEKYRGLSNTLEAVEIYLADNITLKKSGEGGQNGDI